MVIAPIAVLYAVLSVPINAMMLHQVSGPIKVAKRSAIV